MGLMEHIKFSIKRYLINNHYLLMKTLDFVFGMGFVGFLPISCTFHMVGGLLPGDKTSSGNKDENLELSAENSIISL